MKAYKIKIPNEEISRMVQEKAFEMGYEWLMKRDSVSYLEYSCLYLNADGVICTSDYTYFEKHPNEEITWQEFLFGEGYYFYCPDCHISPNITYFQAKSDNVVHWVSGVDGNYSKTQYKWKEWLGGTWVECDKDGNKKENNMFTKNDLKNGKHVVEHENGERYLFIGGRFVNEYGWSPISMWDSNLTFQNRSDNEWDIVKVYRVDNPTNFSVILNNSVCIWERKEEEEYEEMSVADIEKALGKKIKIVKEDV